MSVECSARANLYSPGERLRQGEKTEADRVRAFYLDREKRTLCTRRVAFLLGTCFFFLYYYRVTVSGGIVLFLINILWNFKSTADKIRRGNGKE